MLRSPLRLPNCQETEIHLNSLARDSRLHEDKHFNEQIIQKRPWDDQGAGISKRPLCVADFPVLLVAENISDVRY